MPKNTTDDPQDEHTERPTAAAPGSAARFARALAAEVRSVWLRWGTARLLASLLPNHALIRLRTSIYRAGGLCVGYGTVFYGSATVWGPPGASVKRLVIGRHCRLNSPIYFELDAEIRIGDSVAIGPGVMLLTANHAMEDGRNRAGLNRVAPIRIGDGCWICAGSIILPGIAIGSGAVVGAGSIVAADVPPDTLVAGNPARFIRALPKID